MRDALSGNEYLFRHTIRHYCEARCCCKGLSDTAGSQWNPASQQRNQCDVPLGLWDTHLFLSSSSRAISLLICSRFSRSSSRAAEGQHGWDSGWRNHDWCCGLTFYKLVVVVLEWSTLLRHFLLIVGCDIVERLRFSDSSWQFLMISSSGTKIAG